MFQNSHYSKPQWYKERLSDWQNMFAITALCQDYFHNYCNILLSLGWRIPFVKARSFTGFNFQISYLNQRSVDSLPMHIASFCQENTKAEKNSLEIITRPKRKYTVHRNQKLVEMDKLWYFKFRSWLWGQNHLKIQGWILHFFCFIFFFLKTSPPPRLSQGLDARGPLI